MSTNAPIRPFSIALVNDHIADLVRRAEMLGQLQSVVAQALDPELAAHCRAANLADGRLTFITTSSIWATRLRFESTKLLDRFRDIPLTRTVRQISVKVSPFSLAWEAKNRPIRPLSAASASLLRDVADTVTDPALRSALMRLSRHNRTEKP